jgi:hypothetical protein
MSIWTDEPNNESVKLNRIYRILNEGMGCPSCAKKDTEIARLKTAVESADSAYAIIFGRNVDLKADADRREEAAFRAGWTACVEHAHDDGWLDDAFAAYRASRGTP